MTYMDVTLAPDDIEWDGDRRCYSTETFKDSLFDDALFNECVSEIGLVDALRSYTKFHRIIANKLISQAVDDPDISDWATRTISLCNRAKKRRQQVRRMLRDRDGHRVAKRIIDALTVEFPRAEWGVAA